MIIGAEGKTGNGVQLFDPETGVLRVLDSSSCGLFRSRLAKGRGRPGRLPGQDRRAQRWADAGRPGLDGDRHKVRTRADLRPDDRYRVPGRAADGDVPPVILVGRRENDLSRARQMGRQARAPGQGGKGADAAADKDPAGRTAKAAPPPPSMSRRPSRSGTARMSSSCPGRRSTPPRTGGGTCSPHWQLESGKLVRLGKDPINEQMTPIQRTNLATVAEWSKYAFNRTIGRPAADLYLVDVATGARTKIRDDIDDHYVQASPGGKYLLFLQNDHYWTVNLATRAITNITKSAPTSFINKESDETIEQKPPFGVAGWTKDDAAVLLYDKYDLWKIAADGSKAQQADKRRGRTGPSPAGPLGRRRRRRQGRRRARTVRGRTGDRSRQAPVYLSLYRRMDEEVRLRPPQARRARSPASSGSTGASARWPRPRTPRSTATSSRTTTSRPIFSSAARI